MQPSDALIDAMIRKGKTTNEWGYNDIQSFARLVWAEAMRAREGWVMVPVEPTLAMLAAGSAVPENMDDPEGVYRAMLAAAPKGDA